MKRSTRRFNPTRLTQWLAPLLLGLLLLALLAVIAFVLLAAFGVAF